MSQRFVTIALSVPLVFAVLLSATARAHDFPEKSVMNAFIRLEHERAHLVIRVPLHLLVSSSFPANPQRELDLEHAGPAVERALAGIGEDIRIRENGVSLVPSQAVGRLTLPSDRSFESYDEAIHHVARPVVPATVIYAEQGFLDAHFTYGIKSPTSDFTIQTTMLPRLKESLKLVVRFIPLDGSVRAYEITSFSGSVPVDPRWYQAARIFVNEGFFHILGGPDHLLFLLCLIIPIRRFWDLLPIVTSFTIAHSVTLIGSAYGAVPTGEWFPPLVETVIAGSIVYMALENIFGANLRRRWLITGAFGLAHGFGFAYGLTQTLQFAGSHLLVSLLSFNVGIELGQITILLVGLPTLSVVLGHVRVERLGVIVLSALLAHTGWHWMLDRAAGLRRVEWPMPDATLAMWFARWALLLLLVGGFAWAVARRLERRALGQQRRTEEDIA